MNDTMNRMVQLAISNNAPEDLALGFIRYEVVRRMNPRSFADLVRGNVMGKRFDDLVDDAISASYASTIEECDLCHEEHPLRDFSWTGTQMLCEKCRRIE